MNKIKIIVDPGSTHMGKFDYAIELINTAFSCGADAIKFQLFKNLPPNIPLPYEYFKDLKSYADELKIELFASVWDLEGLNLLAECGCDSIKFSHSQRFSILKNYEILNQFKNVYTSYSIIDDKTESDIKLFCIPEYPLMYTPNFGNILDNMFQGFSDHSLGCHVALKAVDSGARIIEKHITLDRPDIRCPDNYFALNPIELQRFIRKVKS